MSSKYRRQIDTPGPDAVAAKPYIEARSPSQPSVSCLRGVMLVWSECPAVERVPGKVSREWLFKGKARVPVRALFKNLENGARVDDFLTWFPRVTREDVGAGPATRETQPGAGVGRTRSPYRCTPVIRRCGGCRAGALRPQPYHILLI